MKALVVYYSRTGVTEAVAQQIAHALGPESCQLAAIEDLRDRAGAINYIKAGRDAALGKTTEIADGTPSPEGFDVLIVGTPCWAATMAPAIRTYLAKHAAAIANPALKLAYFVTLGGSGGNRTIAKMADLAGRPPVAQMVLTERDVKADKIASAIEAFAAALKSAT